MPTETSLTTKELTDLVTRTGSYTKAAEIAGISRQAVHQRVGQALHTSSSPSHCIDCGKALQVANRKNPRSRCPRCWQFFHRHGIPRTDENVERVMVQGVQRTRQANTREFCVRGHARIPENLYKHGSCKQCARSPERKASQAAYMKRRYYEDPEFREQKRAYAHAYHQAKRKAG